MWTNAKILTVLLFCLIAGNGFAQNEQTFKCENAGYIPTDDALSFQYYFVMVNGNALNILLSNSMTPLDHLGYAHYKKISGIATKFGNSVNSQSTYTLEYSFYDEKSLGFESHKAYFHSKRQLSPLPGGEHQIYYKFQLSNNGDVIDCQQVNKKALYGAK